MPPGRPALDCAAGTPETCGLLAASRRTPNQEWSNPVMAELVAGAVHRVMSKCGAAPEVFQIGAKRAAGNGLPMASMSGVFHFVPQHAGAHRVVAGIPAGLERHSSHHVQTSEIQGLTFDPAGGLAYACLGRDLPVEGTRTFGLA
jgi:hypothetical protein